MNDTAAVERVAREGYGRLRAILAARTHNLAAAEDALAEAFRAALDQWPRNGVPESPEGWLLAVAKRRLADEQRRDYRHLRHEPALRSELEATLAAVDGLEHEPEVPERRLELLFVCAHPAIDPPARTPLMLQAVFGMDAARIASAFLVDPRAMGQRLVRAKAKIRTAGIPFRLPGREEWPPRLEAVLDAVYAAYGAEPDGRTEGLEAEAVHLARLLVRLLPEEPEALGLLALMLHREARRSAARGPGGDYIPLLEQDTTRWDRALADEAEALLGRALRGGVRGKYQIEAAIQSAHAERGRSGGVPYPAILALYRALLETAPGTGAQVAYAAALHQSGDHAQALAVLDEVPEPPAADYQPYWAVRAHVLRALGRSGSGEAFRRAAGLARDPAVRRHLLRMAEKGAGPV